MNSLVDMTTVGCVYNSNSQLMRYVEAKLNWPMYLGGGKVELAEVESKLNLTDDQNLNLI